MAPEICSGAFLLKGSRGTKYDILLSSNIGHPDIQLLPSPVFTFRPNPPAPFSKMLFPNLGWRPKGESTSGFLMLNVTFFSFLS